MLGHVRPDSTAQATIEQLGSILRPNGRVVCSVHRQLEDTRSRELTRHADGYKITQRDGQCPTKDDTFGWSVTVTMTHNITGETRRTTTTTTLRAFTPSELSKWFERAGFEAVQTRRREYVDGPAESDRAFLLTAQCPG